MKLSRAYIPTPAPQEQIHARFAGVSGPFVFFLHPWPLGSLQFQRVILPLAERYRVYGLDAPGYGMSPSTLTLQPFEEYARRVLDAIDALRAETFTLVGAEIGVAVAAEIARRAGRRVERILALAVPPTDPAGHAAYIAELGEAKPTQDGRHVERVWQQIAARLGPDADPAQLEQAFAEFMNVYNRYHWGIKGYAAFDLAAALRDIRCPMLFLSAGSDPFSVHAPAAAKLVTSAAHHVVEGARPLLAWTDPPAFLSAFDDFMKVRPAA